MCGFAGIAGKSLPPDRRVKIAKAMSDLLAHRGPDDEGYYTAPDALPVALSHRRLAIIDTAHGKQPMETADENFVIVFNGEIYNYLELRRELAGLGCTVQTYSDTEVILHGYAVWGEKVLDRLNGMFSFVILDRRKKKLFCARDRFGIKPFYYWQGGGSFLFASEIKALLASGLFKAEMNREALADYTTFQFYLGGKTLFEGVKELEPGWCMTIDLSADSPKAIAHQYWDLSYDIDETLTEAVCIDKLAFLIEDAVRLQLRSDVAIGGYLSGGLDSSSVVSLAARMLDGEVFKTFTGAFKEGKAFDETEYARMVAEQHSNIDPHEMFIDGSAFVETMPKLIYYMDQPQAGPGLFPQYAVSKLASENVKVVLGGQGGDEIFIGYARYLVGYLEKCLRGAIFDTANKSKYAVTLETMIPNLPALRQYVPMLQGFLGDDLFEDSDKRYFKLIDRSSSLRGLLSADILDIAYRPFDSFSEIFNRDNLHSLINQMTHFDLKASLPALLHVEDRMSMAVSVESRVPLLDHRIAEFVATIPPNIKFSGGRLKGLFKNVVRHSLPKKVVERKDKMGFPVPLSQWYNGLAHEFVCDTLLSERAKTRGYYNPKAVEKLIENETTFGRGIWGLLCLELWSQIFLDGERP